MAEAAKPRVCAVRTTRALVHGRWWGGSTRDQNACDVDGLAGYFFAGSTSR